MAVRTTFTTQQHRLGSITNNLIADSTISELKFDTNLNGKILLSNIARSWLVNQSAGGYKLINLATGVDSTDAVNLAQLNNALDLKLDRTQLLTNDVGPQQINWATAGDGDIPSALAVKNYLTSSSVVIVSEETPSGSINGTNMEFVLSHLPISGSVVLYMNGVRLRYGFDADYTISTQTITMVYPPEVGDQLVATYTYSSSGGESIIVSFTQVIDFGSA